jgi:lysophospholipase L1-like esterase
MTPPTVIEKRIGAHWFLGPLQLAWRNRDITAIAAAMRRQRGDVVDIHRLFGNPPRHPDWLLDDGLHPSLEGQKAIVSALVDHLAKA